MDFLSIVLLAVCAILSIVSFVFLYRIRRHRSELAQLNLIKQMMEALPQSIFLLNDKRIILETYNVTPQMLAGYPKEAIVGHPISVFIDDSDSPFNQVCTMLDASFEEMGQTDRPIQFEYMIEECHFEATISEIEGGLVVCQVRDVSNIVHNRQEIEHRSRTYLMVALAAGGLLSWRYDVLDDNFSYLYDPENGYSLDGSTLSDVLEFFAPKYRSEVDRLFSDLINKRADRYEVTVQAYDLNQQQLQWQHIYAVPYEYSPEGKVLRVVGFQRDVTSMQENEQELILNRKKLEFAIRVAGLQQWEYNIPDDTFYSEQDKLSVPELFSSEELMKLVHPSDQFLFKHELDKIIERVSDSIHIQMRLMRPSGNFEWFTVDAALFKEDEETKEALLIIGLLDNINDSVRMTNELIELRDKADESNRLKSSFLANMSHEIRTPLNAIVGFSNLIGQTDDKDEIGEYLKIIETNNELLLTLIDDILDLSRIETGKIQFSYTSISINQLLAQLQQSTQLRVKSGVEVVLEDLEEDMVIYSDMSRVTQIVANFLNNAAKFTTSGSITIGCKRVDTGFRFHVTDTGIGILKENLPSIFNRFIKLNPNVQGTGLGLSICSMIVQLLGGAIGADSVEGEGSTFWCILPSTDKGKMSEVLLTDMVDFGSSDEVSSGNRGKKILIAEDNINNFNLYVKLLTEYKIVHAWNGSEAIEIFHDLQPDLIIMDLSMPLMDGYKATSIIREHAPSIPIIAVSASVLPEERTIALSNGFTDFVMKPIDGNRFRRMINHYIQ